MSLASAVSVVTEFRIIAGDQSLDTPLIAVDLDVLQRNIAEMAALAASYGVALRPHAKTHKSPHIARMQVEAGAVGLTCAKLGEAEVLVDQAGVTDILIAYPIVGDIKIQRLLHLLERAHVTVAVDTHQAAAALSEAVAVNDRILDVYLEVNTGQDRAGARAGQEAVELAVTISRMPGLRLAGIMTHEGHAGFSDPDQIATVAENAGQALVDTAERIRRQGIEVAQVSVGSTPASWFTPRVPGITEMRPGTYVFHDNNAFRHGRIGPDRCAARVVSTVVSRPSGQPQSHRAVIDAGSNALAFDPSSSHPGHGYIVGHPGATIARLSEEHGVVTLSPDELGFDVGDQVEIIPNHICPAVNLTDELVIVQDGHVVDHWPVAARGKVR